MDISARKLNLVQEFLKVSDETVISKIETILLNEKRKKLTQKTGPLTISEFNSIIDKSEIDIKSGKVAEPKEI